MAQAAASDFAGLPDFAGISAQWSFRKAGAVAVAAIASHAPPIRRTSAEANSASTTCRALASERGRIRATALF